MKTLLNIAKDWKYLRRNGPIGVDGNIVGAGLVPEERVWEQHQRRIEREAQRNERERFPVEERAPEIRAYHFLLFCQRFFLAGEARPWGLAIVNKMQWSLVEIRSGARDGHSPSGDPLPGLRNPDQKKRFGTPRRNG